jgi:Na+-transporting methylmalonyl-CoA/oxaloacetate decarboxylase beta subunit
MESNKLSELNTETLRKKYNSVKAMAKTLAGVLLISFFLLIFISIKKGFSPLCIVPIALLPILILNIININNIKKELNSREV